MTRKDAIEAIKCNWPDSRYTILREALNMAVKALEDVTDKNVGKMTNADRIRAMSDEELAVLIAREIVHVPHSGFYVAKSAWLRWLHETVEEQDG